MRKFIGRVFATIGFLVVALAVGGGVAWFYLEPEPKAVPAMTVLELDLERGIAEFRDGLPIESYFGTAKPTLLELVRTLRRAGEDDRVKGLIARAGTVGGMGYGQVQEIRDAVKAFREAGKFAIAYADSFSEFGPGTKAYYLASAFDEIWLQPSGNVGLTGLIAEQPFGRQALEDFEIQPQIERRHEYKTVMSFATESGFTEAGRESTQQLIDSLYGQVVDGIAEGRGLKAPAVRRLVDNGPFLGQEALDAGLIDGLAYRDQVYEAAREKAGETDAEEASVLKIESYLARLEPPDAEHRIALIYGVGLVNRGKSRLSPLFGGRSMGAETLVKAFRDAVEDDEVKAIVFRIDSGGGSYVASDSIRREVARAAATGKPVIVSMGNTAASGGYFVALPAQTIVAQPGTITGSIGVLAGKMATGGLWRKWGVNWESVQAGANAAMWSFVRPYDRRGQVRLQAVVDRIYADFAGKVGEARGLSDEKLDQAARGRVWTGQDAKDRGLVDELGGLPLAVTLAKAAGGIPAEAEVEIRQFPASKNLMERLLARLRGNPASRQAAVLTQLGQAVERFRPWLDQALAAAGDPQGPSLRMPHLNLR